MENETKKAVGAIMIRNVPFLTEIMIRNPHEPASPKVVRSRFGVEEAEQVAVARTSTEERQRILDNLPDRQGRFLGRTSAIRRQHTILSSEIWLAKNATGEMSELEGVDPNVGIGSFQDTLPPAINEIDPAELQRVFFPLTLAGDFASEKHLKQPEPETGKALERSADVGGNDDDSIDEEVGELLELIKGTAEHITGVIDRELEASTKSFARIDHLLDQAAESQRRVDAWLNRRS